MVPFNAAEYFLDRHVQAGRGDRLALRVHGRSLTYADLLAAACAAAGGLRRLGVRPEERVLLVLLDGVEFVATFLGAMRLGAVPVPVNPLLPGPDLASIAADARAGVAVLSGEKAAVAADLAAGAPELTALVVTGAGPLPREHRLDVHRYCEALEEPAEVAHHAAWEDSPGFWLCTSGTTGRPSDPVFRSRPPRCAPGSGAVPTPAARRS